MRNYFFSQQFCFGFFSPQLCNSLYIYKNFYMNFEKKGFLLPHTTSKNFQSVVEIFTLAPQLQTDKLEMYLAKKTGLK